MSALTDPSPLRRAPSFGAMTRSPSPRPRAGSVAYLNNPDNILEMEVPKWDTG